MTYIKPRLAINNKISCCNANAQKITFFVYYFPLNSVEILDNYDWSSENF